MLLDFCYLKTPALFEHRIEGSAELIARDAEVWEVHGAIVVKSTTRFEVNSKIHGDREKLGTLYAQVAIN